VVDIFDFFCFRDVKCVLELDFAFRIHALSLCEEFLLCASTTECQSIQLNFSPYVCSVDCGDNKELSDSAQFGTAVVADRLTCPKDCQNASVNNDISSAGSRRNDAAADRAGSSANDADVGSLEHSRSSAISHPARLRQEFVRTDLGLSPTSGECDELFVGPVKGSQAPCPVSVEFEGSIFICWNCITSHFVLCFCELRFVFFCL